MALTDIVLSHPVRLRRLAEHTSRLAFARLLVAFVLCHAVVGCSSHDGSTAAGIDPGGATAGGGGLSGAGGVASGMLAGTGTLGGAAGGGTAAGGAAAGGASTGGVAGGGGAVGGTMGGGAVAPISIDQCGADNPGQLGSAQLAALKAGGKPGAMRVLYPYDGTVFPRGLTAPVLMWDGAGSDAVQVHIKAGTFEYRGCFKANAVGQLQFPQAIWSMMGEHAGGASDPFTVELTTLSGQAATGPVTQRLIVAKATLKGSIYYNSYNTQLGGGFGNNGAILRIRPGQTAQVFARQDTCTGCHSVSANGERMTARELGIGGPGGGALGGLLGGLGGIAGGAAGGLAGAGDGPVYALTPDTAPNPAPLRTAIGTAFAGLTPDGKLYVASASRFDVGPQLQGGLGPSAVDSALYETDTGTVVADSGVPTGAMMPTFSSDGTLLVFSDAAQGGKAIVLMRFDPKTRKASQPRTLISNAHLLGWPFVLPDNRAVIFTITDRNDFGGGGVGIGGPAANGPVSDVGLVDLQTGKTIMLAQALGFRTQADADANKTYLPFGAEELHQVYYPTVSPVSAGGYFWLFFDSVRHYGNQGAHRQLWGAAIAVASMTELSTGLYESDPSFPAFYLAGQELPVANHRAFTALDPCRADGAKCETGVDCCNGFCTNGICGRDMPRCSQTNEVCKTSSDCCKKTDSCVGGFCDIILN